MCWVLMTLVQVWRPHRVSHVSGMIDSDPWPVISTCIQHWSMLDHWIHETLSISHDRLWSASCLCLQDTAATCPPRVQTHFLFIILLQLRTRWNVLPRDQEQILDSFDSLWRQDASGQWNLIWYWYLWSQHMDCWINMSYSGLIIVRSHLERGYPDSDTSSESSHIRDNLYNCSDKDWYWLN